MSVSDSEVLEEIYSIVRNHYRAHYTGYDTYIDSTNIFEHIQSLCKAEVTLTERLKSINLLAEGDL